MDGVFARSLNTNPNLFAVGPDSDAYRKADVEIARFKQALRRDFLVFTATVNINDNTASKVCLMGLSVDLHPNLTRVNFGCKSTGSVLRADSQVSRAGYLEPDRASKAFQISQVTWQVGCTKQLSKQGSAHCALFKCTY